VEVAFEVIADRKRDQLSLAGFGTSRSSNRELGGPCLEEHVARYAPGGEAQGESDHDDVAERAGHAARAHLHCW